MDSLDIETQVRTVPLRCGHQETIGVLLPEGQPSRVEIVGCEGRATIATAEVAPNGYEVVVTAGDREGTVVVSLRYYGSRTRMDVTAHVHVYWRRGE